MNSLIRILFVLLVLDSGIHSGIIDSNDKYTIIMSLAKSEYKMYEPVLAKIELINNDTLPMTVYTLYSISSYEPSVKIFKWNGEIYSDQGVRGFYISRPSTIIQPRDTLVFSLPINRWGNPVESSGNMDFTNVYFDNFGYFPPGEYFAYFDFSENSMSRYSTYVRSNDVAFNVSELTEEDEQILKLYKQNKPDEILKDFPENPFSEHILMWKMLPYWNKVNEFIESDYGIFKNKYPESFYFLYWRFILPLLVSAQDKYNDFDKGLLYLQAQQEEGSFLAKVLQNKPFTNIIKYYGRPYEEIK